MKPHYPYKHGHRKRGMQDRTYLSWQSMKSRCLNPNSSMYRHYGGRGITICKRWRDNFESFLLDMGRCPAGLTIERIDNNAGYFPKNCRWATASEQSNNTRRNRIITIDGVKLNYRQWEIRNGLPRHTVASRVSKGWNPKRAITTPVHRAPMLHLEGSGCVLTIKQWAKRTGISATTINRRLRNGWSVTQALTLRPWSRICL